MDLIEMITTILIGLATTIPLIISLIKYIKESIRQKNWYNLFNLVINLMQEAENKFNDGITKEEYVLDMVKAFSSVNGIEIPYKIVGRRDGDIAECYADASKAQEVLGWSAELTLDDMCRDSWNWQKNNPEGYK